MCFRLLSFVLLPLSTITCTMVGFHRESLREKMDFGATRSFVVCVVPEVGISAEEVNDLFQFWNDELALYKLQAIVYLQPSQERPGFYGSDILEFLNRTPIPPPCDRLLYLKGRTWGDLGFEGLTLGLFALSGLKLEVQGAVESRTQTKGYIKAKYISLLQLLFTSPKSTLVHEGYHLLGCGHQFFLTDCYEKILEVKGFARELEGRTNVFPSIPTHGKKLLPR